MNARTNHNGTLNKAGARISAGRTALLLAGLLLAAMAFQGCGGGGSASPSAPIGPSIKTGSLRLAIFPPKTSGREAAVIPSGTTKIVISIHGDSEADEITRTVTDISSTVQVTILGIPVGVKTLSISARNNSDELLALRDQIVTIEEGKIKDVKATLGFTIIGASSVLPTSIAYDPGDALVIKNGSGSTVSVSMGSVECPTSLTLGDQGQIKCFPQTAGTYSIYAGSGSASAVVGPGSLSSLKAGISANVTYGEAPLEASFLASVAAPSGLTGSPSYSWSLGGGSLGSGSSLGSSELDGVFSDPGDYTVNLTVTQGGQTATDTVLVTVVNPPAPIVTQVSPVTHLNTQSGTLSIIGENFKSGATVKVGATAVSSVEVVGSTLIYAVIPVNFTAGTHTVTVTNPDGQSGSMANAFTVTAPGSTECGNGTTETGEQCDDGDTTSNDGCSATCQLEAPTSCTGTCASYVAAAKGHLFIPSVTRSDYEAAVSAVASAAALSPKHPDVNFLQSLLDLLTEGDRVGTDVLFTPEDIFPLDFGYDATSGTLGRAASTITGPILSGLPRLAQAFSSDEPTSAEIRTEVVANTLPTLEAALDKLDAARYFGTSISGWTFTYPKDPANPLLGDSEIVVDDLTLLAGALRLAISQIYQAVAYETTISNTWTDPCPSEKCAWGFNPNTQMWEETCTEETDEITRANLNTCAAADVNSDGLLTPAEYFPPTPFATLGTNGAAHLAAASAHWSDGLALLDAGVDSILAKAQQEVGGNTLSAKLLGDIQYYKHYLTELAASSAGTTTEIDMPETIDCWRLNAWDYYELDTILDPSHDPSDTTGCLAEITTKQATAIPMNLQKLFSISDLRDVMPTYEILNSDTGAKVFATDYVGSTVGGIFPNGLQKAWLDEKTLGISANFTLTDANTGNAPMVDLTSSTLTIGEKTFTASWSWTGQVYFYPPWPETLPTAADYIAFNDTFGETAILQVPGYNSVNVTVMDGISLAVTLTPSAL